MAKLEEKCARKVVCSIKDCEDCNGYDALRDCYVPIGYADMTIEEVQRDYYERKELREKLK